MTSRNTKTKSLVRGFFYLLLSLDLLLLSCTFIPPSYTKNSDHLVYLARFKEFCTLYKKDCSRLKTLKIGIGEINFVVKLLNPGTIGTCVPTDNEIVLSEKYWRDATFVEKESLVFHELGHCILNKEHDDTKVNIMNSSTFDDFMYLINYQYMMDKLFDCKRDCPVVRFDRSYYSKDR